MPTEEIIPGRGVVYIAWGLDKHPQLRAGLEHSRLSLQAVHPELPVTVRELPEGSGLLDKARMYDLSPYEHTLYLDVDTQVLSRLDFGFEKARKHGVACAICEAPFACRYTKAIKGDVIEYNTGVLFFSRSQPVEHLFRRWNELSRTVNSSSLFHSNDGIQEMKENDQASFAVAVEETGFHPFVLPQNWNFRPRFMAMAYGPVKVWHDWNPVPPPLTANWAKQASTNMMKFVQLAGGR